MTLSDVLNALIQNPNHPDLTNFINGEFLKSEEVIESINPATGKAWIRIANSTKNEVSEAISAAESAFLTWSETSIKQRSDLMNKLADLIEKHLEEFAILESRDQGKPISLAKAVDIPRCVYNFRFFASAMLHHVSPSTILDGPVKAVNYVKYDPVGVAGLISPWNLPLYLLSFKIAPAVICGNTVVCKPSEMTSVTAWALMHAVKEAGFPPGVINLVTGVGNVAGMELVTDPRVPLISFTGSTKIGKLIGELGAKTNKKVSLEMGGKNAAIVLSDANLDDVVPQIARSCFANQGEICLCTSRIFAHESIFEEFLGKLVIEAKKLTVGDPTGNFNIGAMNSLVHFKKVESYIETARKDGIVHCGGVQKLDGSFSEGYFIAPTVVSGMPDTSACMTEEIFGPVVCVTPFKDVKDAISRANSVEYGLSATVWGSKADDILNVAHKLRVGTVWCNTWMTRDLNMPFGGCKQSGQGREGVHDSIHFYTDAKTICLKL